MTDDASDKARMSRADLMMGLVLVALGVTIFLASWGMPRLEVRRIPVFTAPGVVPGLLSIALTICGGVMAIRSWRARSPGGFALLGRALTSREALRALAVIALCLAFGLGLVGRIPFWAATAAFVFGFVLVFEQWLAEKRRPPLVSLGWAVGLSVATAAAIVLVFQYGFLVRLP